jgi:ethanolamine utilization protein EutA (predicted chaperonin)
MKLNKIAFLLRGTPSALLVIGAGFVMASSADIRAALGMGAAEFTALQPEIFNTVVSAVSFKLDGATYYGFYSRSIGFHQMDVFFVIDENGAIAKMDATQFIFDEEYFGSFAGMDKTAYKAGFVGLTGETFNGDAAMIATATMTSNAMKESTTDAFAAFESIKGGEQ